jgi:hypothetical protein
MWTMSRNSGRQRPPTCRQDDKSFHWLWLPVGCQQHSWVAHRIDADELFRLRFEMQEFILPERRKACHVRRDRNLFFFGFFGVLARELSRIIQNSYVLKLKL